MYVRKKELRKKFGTSDVEGLALNMYNVFHSHPATNLGWTPYQKQKDDIVVQTFRMAALIDTEEIEYNDIGSIYHEDVV